MPATYTLEAGTPHETTYETYLPGEFPAVGQIVQLPDGRAGEVVSITDPGVGNHFHINVRAWDGTMCYAFYASQLHPYVEIGSTPDA